MKGQELRMKGLRMKWPYRERSACRLDGRPVHKKRQRRKELEPHRRVLRTRELRTQVPYTKARDTLKIFFCPSDGH